MTEDKMERSRRFATRTVAWIGVCAALRPCFWMPPEERAAYLKSQSADLEQLWEALRSTKETEPPAT